jgi:hypothetical protein
MGYSSRYWELIKIVPSQDGCGYKVQELINAKDFFHQQFPSLAVRAVIVDQQVQNQLFQLLPVKTSTSIQLLQSTAELCFRCYISYFILHSCVRRARLFSAGGRINYRDLLPFVLNDDGGALQGSFIPFSVEILFSFCQKRDCSLASWVDLKVKRHKDLNKFLLEFDIEIRSNWAILNKAAASHLDEQQDKEILAVFHTVYRWDRLGQHYQKLGGRCSEPTQAQLEAMIRHLHKRGIYINSSYDMLNELEKIVKFLRQRSIWGKTGYPATESIDESNHNADDVYRWQEAFFDPKSQGDLAVNLEEQELQDFFQHQLFECLDESIKEQVEKLISKQSQSRGYASLAPLIKPILKLIYCEGKSQTEIAQQLDINKTKLTRLVHPTNLLKNIRSQAVDILFKKIIDKANELGYLQLPLNKDNFDFLIQHVEAYVDKEIFLTLYTQRLCFFLNN